MVDPDGMGNEEELREIDGGGIVTRMNYVRKKAILNERKSRNTKIIFIKQKECPYLL